MKRGALDGFNGTVSSMVGEYAKQNLNGNLNYRTDNFNVFTNANYRTGNRIGDGKRKFDYIYPSYSDKVYTNTYRKRTPNDFGLRFGGDFYPSKVSTIGYTFDISQHNETTFQEFSFGVVFVLIRKYMIHVQTIIAFSCLQDPYHIWV